MIQEVKRKREGKDQSEEQRSIRKFPIRSLHGSKSIAAADECKALSNCGVGDLADPLRHFPTSHFTDYRVNECYGDLSPISRRSVFALELKRPGAAEIE
jgi:hypothetical protein